MNRSDIRTVVLPAAVAGGNSTAIAHGTTVPVRVEVTNLSGAPAFLSYASQDVVGGGGIGSAVYSLLPGQSRVYVLKDGQQMFAAGQGANVRVAVQMNEALPLV